MRRVLMLTTFYPPYNFGGDAVDAESWATALARRGCEVVVVHNADAYLALGGRPQPEHRRDDNVEVVPLRSRTGRGALLLAQQTGRPCLYGPELRRLCSERRFDTVIFMNVSLMGGPAVFSICPGAIKIYVATEHWLICPTHVLWRYDGVPCDERQCLRCTLHHRRPPQLWRHTSLLADAGRHIDLFVARSEFSRRKHRAYDFPFDMEVVPAFVSRPAAATEPASPHPRPYFLFVGRIEELKGLGDVLPLFDRDRGADLVVAGTGTAEPKLRAATAASPHVRWLGFVPRHRLSDWYRHATAVIVPSTTYETFGIVVIEAMSHGTPVIARRRGPLPELLERGGGGLLFDTPEQLDHALHSLLHDPERRQALSGDALASFERHWTEDAVVPPFIDMVENIRSRKFARHDGAASTGA